ncbi:MAG: UDP-glucose 6-dehydrogenase [Phenylobacterium sp.]|nr:UDP-glucose 6-dehydrogenase [Phenylobacterium sp.]
MDRPSLNRAHPGEPSLRIIVIGSGYVGLVSGACLAEIGHRVTCVDTDAARIAGLRAGRSPIFELGLEAMIARNVAAGRLSFDGWPAELAEADAALIAVGTPPRADDGQADLSAVLDAARMLAPQLGAQAVVVIKSTVPPGTGDTVEQLLASCRPDLDPVVISNPEFLREGSAIADFLAPDRIVVGCDTASGRAVMAELYQPLTAKGAPLLFMDRRTAELTKYAANAFLATKISFINEMADLCEALGADVTQVARGMGMDRRIGTGFLEAGPGYGGSCFPKDTSALLATARAHSARLRVVEGASVSNALRQAGLIGRVQSALGGDAAGKTVAVLGLTFKPGTDDMRDAPSVRLIDALQAAGAAVRVYDPKGMDQARGRLIGVDFTEDPYACAGGAHAIVLMTHWTEFQDLDLDRLAGVVRQQVFIDLRNALDADAVVRAGFTLHGVGRPPRGPVDAASDRPQPVAWPHTPGRSSDPASDALSCAAG